MNIKKRKRLQKFYAKKTIELYSTAIKEDFYSPYNSKYVKEILNFSSSFNIRLTREEKLQFCKKCFCAWDSKTRTIFFDQKTHTKNYICKMCGFTRRFKYK